MDLITVKNLCKTFPTTEGKILAVNNLSFTVKKGEIFGLLGVNGAGKSTLITMLTGLTLPDSGKITIFGKDLQQHREEILQRCNIATAYYTLSYNLSVMENLRVYALLYQVPQAKQKIKKLTEEFMIGHLLKASIRTLSSGEQTRLNMVKALLNDPELLFLDECTAGLDPHMAEITRDYLKAYQKKTGCTIIFTSHNMREVEELCHCIAFMNQGKIVATGTASQLLKELEVQTIHLHVPHHLSQTQTFLKKLHLPFTQEGNLIYFSVKNRKKVIYPILERLVKEKIAFDDIHLEKPTLEQYFIHHAKKTIKK